MVIASKNLEKIAEVEAVLLATGFVSEIVRGRVWEDVEETEDTLEGNALLKARAVYATTGVSAVADDSGLEVDALEGAPGVYSARYAGPSCTPDDNVNKILRELDGVERRTARFRTAVAFVGIVDGRPVEITTDGALEGTIAWERRGSGGFGYDPIFVLSDGRSLAEVDGEEKNRISHRAKAIQALAEALSPGLADVGLRIPRRPKR